MAGAVEQGLVVDLVGEDHEVVLARDLDQFEQQRVRVERTGRVVRIDHDQRAGVGRDPRADVVEVWQPVGRLVADVVLRHPAGQRHGSGPQRIVGRRDQHLVAVVEQRLHAHHDQLRDTIADVDVVDADARDLLLLRVVHDRLARSKHAFRFGIARRLPQIVDDVDDDLLGRLEAERREIADVELDDAVPFVFELFRPTQYRATDVIADVGELGGLVQCRRHRALGLARGLLGGGLAGDRQFGSSGHGSTIRGGVQPPADVQSAAKGQRI